MSTKAHKASSRSTSSPSASEAPERARLRLIETTDGERREPSIARPGDGGLASGTALSRSLAGSRATPRAEIESVLEDHQRALGIAATSDRLGAIREDVRALVELLVAGATAEHGIEHARVTPAPDHRVLHSVLRVLEGDDGAAAGLPYELSDRAHLGLIACGEGVEATLRGVARTAHLRMLAVKAPDGDLWAWLSGSTPLPTAEVERRLGACAANDATYAIGAPRAGLEGFRSTHMQARGALQLARLLPRPVTSYEANPLLATALSDEPLRAWLGDFVTRLGAHDERGAALAAALAAYIDSGFNAASAAASLGIGRRTVERRLADAEALIGRPLRACAAELRVALQLQALVGAR